MPAALAAQLRVDPRRAMAAPGPLVLLFDEHGQSHVFPVPGRGLAVRGGIVGGAGDLEQLARPLDVAVLRFSPCAPVARDDDLHVLARSQIMYQPGKPDADAGADLQDPATAGDRRGQGGQQSAHFDLAGEPETGSGGSFVRGQNVLGKLLAPGHQTILPSTRAACLTTTRPQPAAAAYRGAARLPHDRRSGACSVPAPRQPHPTPDPPD
jgi:hypothetical protein